MEISNSAVLLANEQMIFVKIFAIYSFMQKRLCSWNARKCSIKEDFNQNGSLSIS